MRRGVVETDKGKRETVIVVGDIREVGEDPSHDLRGHLNIKTLLLLVPLCHLSRFYPKTARKPNARQTYAGEKGIVKLKMMVGFLQWSSTT
jgi:hypothetical protein